MLVWAIYVIAFLILVALAFWVINQLGLPEPIKRVLTIVLVVVVVIILVVWMVSWAGAAPSAFPPFPRK